MDIPILFRSALLYQYRKMINLIGQSYLYTNKIKITMKTRSLILLLFIYLPIPLIACSFIPETFCKTMAMFEEDHIISGKIISIDEDGLNLEVIDVLRGEESKEIIRIWDGTDFDCNGNWPMDCSSIGEVGESVLIILPKITEIENPWDVIGDYRRPNPYSFMSQLDIIGDDVEGLIAGNAIAPPEFNVLSFDYEDLAEIILSGGDCMDILSTTDPFDHGDPLRYNNPVLDELYLEVSTTNLHQIVVYSIQGTILKTIPADHQKEIQIPFQDLPSGQYLVEVTRNNQRPEYIKIVHY